MKMGSKPPNQMHTSKPKANRSGAKGTMGTGKVSAKVSGAMGKNQSTGSGEGS